MANWRADRVEFFQDTRLWLVEHVNYEDYETVVVAADHPDRAMDQGLFAMSRPQTDRKNLKVRIIGPVVGLYRIVLEYMVYADPRKESGPRDGPAGPQAKAHA